MNNIEFVLQFSILPYKYIILYIDNDIYDENINNKLLDDIKNIDNNLTIIRFLSNNEYKKKLDINQIYPDLYTEDILIKYCLCIIYFSKINRSKILLNTIDLYDKYVIYEKDNIINNISYIFNNNSEKLILLNENKNNFKNIYLSLILNKNIMLERNIKLEYNKIFKEYNNEDKINIITYFKNHEVKILNIIQKKCIIENLRNKNVSKVIVLGKNIKTEFQDIYNDNDHSKIIFNLELIEIDEDNVTYKDLLNISNKFCNDIIVCILRSDIILPNQDEIEDLNIELSSKNEIYALSRIDRLISGNLVKSEKLNKTLFSSEQDAWIFKSPININLDLLNNILFYNKYSELYFNKILISNNYKIINNSSKIKIIRILYENNVDNRLLLNNINNINNIDDIHLVPDDYLIDKLSIDNLLSIFNVNNKELYNIKYELFNKYFKNKIINELI
jgi:DUF1009 family protein